MSSHEGHWDAPVACGGIVDPIHSMIPPAAVGKAVRWVLGVARLGTTMLAIIEHGACAISHHFCEEGKERCT